MKIIINNCYSNVQISASINHRFSQSSVYTNTTKKKSSFFIRQTDFF